MHRQNDQLREEDRQQAELLLAAIDHKDVDLFEERLDIICRQHCDALKYQTGRGTLLHAAYKWRESSAFDQLAPLILDKETLQATDNSGRTIFTLAVMRGDLKATQFLYTNFKDSGINEINEGGVTLLHEFIDFGAGNSAPLTEKALEVLDFLLNDENVKKNINTSCNYNKWTVIESACHAGNTEIVRRLIEHGAAKRLLIDAAIKYHSDNEDFIKFAISLLDADDKIKFADAYRKKLLWMKDNEVPYDIQNEFGHKAASKEIYYQICWIISLKRLTQAHFEFDTKVLVLNATESANKRIPSYQLLNSNIFPALYARKVLQTECDQGTTREHNNTDEEWVRESLQVAKKPIEGREKLVSTQIELSVSLKSRTESLKAKKTWIKVALIMAIGILLLVGAAMIAAPLLFSLGLAAIFVMSLLGGGIIGVTAFLLVLEKMSLIDSLVEKIRDRIITKEIVSDLTTSVKDTVENYEQVVRPDMIYAKEHDVNLLQTAYNGCKSFTDLSCYATPDRIIAELETTSRHLDSINTEFKRAKVSRLGMYGSSPQFVKTEKVQFLCDPINKL